MIIYFILVSAFGNNHNMNTILIVMKSHLMAYGK